MQSNSNLAYQNEENQSSLFDMLIETKALSSLQSIHLQNNPGQISMNIDLKIVQDYRIHSVSALFATIESAIDTAKQLINIHSDSNAEDIHEMNDWINELDSKGHTESNIHLFAGSV